MASAADHMAYIHERVNPVLEALVTAVLLDRPDDPVNFMIKWLSEQTPDKIDKKLEVEQVQAEIERLRAKQKELEELLAAGTEKGGGGGAAASVSAEKEASEEEEEDDDDDVDELPPPSSYQKGPRASVSAEAYGEWNKKEDFVPPVVPKTEEQATQIGEKLSSSFMFCNLDTAEKKTVVDAMKIVEVEPDTTIIKEGDEGECLFVISEGVFEFFKKIQGEEKLVKTCSAGEAFGELALLYNCPRAATVICKEKATVLELDRRTFNHIVKDSAMRKRELYDSFLKSVEVLKNLDPFERGRMADALRVSNYKPGDYIINQGDEGNDFFIVEAGECEVTKSSEEEEKVVNVHKAGDFFGELALMKNEPRAANVLAKTDVKCVSLDRRTFNRLLGPLEKVLERQY